MRDPARIRRIAAKLATLWECWPDWRLGQLIDNITPPDQDAFYIEDELLEKLIDAALVQPKDTK